MIDTLDTTRDQLKALDISVVETFESQQRKGYTCFLFTADVSDEKLRELRETFKGDAVPCRNRLYVKVANGKAPVAASGEVADHVVSTPDHSSKAETANTLRRPYRIESKRLVQPIGTAQEREKADAELNALRGEHWLVVNDHVFGLDPNGQQPKLWHILYLEKYVEIDPAPVQPQPAASATPHVEPKPEALVPDAIIEPDEAPEPDEQPEPVMTTAQRYSAESNARIKDAARDAYYHYLAQRPPYTPRPMLGVSP